MTPQKFLCHSRHTQATGACMECSTFVRILCMASVCLPNVVVPSTLHLQFRPPQYHPSSFLFPLQTQQRVCWFHSSCVQLPLDELAGLLTDPRLTGSGEGPLLWIASQRPCGNLRVGAGGDGPRLACAVQSWCAVGSLAGGAVLAALHLRLHSGLGGSGYWA